MNRFYFYFGASLPSLFFDSQPSCACEDFLDDCRRFLSGGDFMSMTAAMNGSMENQASDDGVVNRWIQFDHTLKNQIAAFRAAQKGKDPGDYVKGGLQTSPYVTELLHQAVKCGDPLKAERMIDEARWKYLDELSAWHLLDLDYLIIYGLKLKILGRYQRIFHSSEGKEKLKDYLDIKITL